MKTAQCVNLNKDVCCVCVNLVQVGLNNELSLYPVYKWSNSDLLLTCHDSILCKILNYFLSDFYSASL